MRSFLIQKGNCKFSLFPVKHSWYWKENFLFKIQAAIKIFLWNPRVFGYWLIKNAGRWRCVSGLTILFPKGTHKENCGCHKKMQEEIQEENNKNKETCTSTSSLLPMVIREEDTGSGFQMPLHYPNYTKEDYEDICLNRSLTFSWLLMGNLIFGNWLGFGRSNFAHTWLYSLYTLASQTQSLAIIADGSEKSIVALYLASYSSFMNSTRYM